MSAPTFACKTSAECSKELDEYYGYTPVIWRQGDFDDPRTFQPPPADPGDPAEPATPPRIVTATDLARFLPAQAGIHSEPHGWAVVHVPANFWVDVTPATVDGRLFDTPVQVRFTPTQYLWNYGDGVVAQTDTPGASWKSLHQDELTGTATGHVYQQRGPATVSVRIVYTAQYKVADGDWVPVQGVVVATAPPAQLVVATESTVLTAAAR